MQKFRRLFFVALVFVFVVACAQTLSRPHAQPCYKTPDANSEENRDWQKNPDDEDLGNPPNDEDVWGNDENEGWVEDDCYWR